MIILFTLSAAMRTSSLKVFTLEVPSVKRVSFKCARDDAAGEPVANSGESSSIEIAAGSGWVGFSQQSSFPFPFCVEFPTID